MSTAAAEANYPANRWVIAFVVGLAAFMEVLDISIANVSLTHIAGSLSASQDEATWVLTSYLVSNAVVLPISGWFSQVLGRRRFFLLSIVVFSIASLACGLAPSLGWLIFFRVLQGIGGGGLQPVSQAILADSFPPRQRGMAFAIYGIAVVFAPAIGPTLGGYITDNASWHWIFLLNVPVGIMLLALAVPLIHDSATYQKARKAKIGQGFRVDFVGLFLLAAGLGCLQIMLDQGQQDNWFASSFIVSMGVITASSLTALVLWEPFQRNPMVDLTLFRYKNFALANILMFMLGFVLFGSTLLIPQFVQQLFGYTATLAGLVLSPGGIAIVLFMPLVGYLTGKIQARWLIMIGLATTSVSLFHLAGFTLDVTFNQIMLARIYQTLGLAFLFIPITDGAYIGVPSNKTDEVSAMINLSRNIGGSVGISLVTTWLARHQQSHQEVLSAHVTPYDHATQQTVDGLSRHFQQLGSSTHHATEQAYAAIYQQVQQQAAILSYLDDYWLLGMLVVVLIPLALLIKRPA
ncbi:DHA2 family efflux MFS transporter permease subunit [Salinisphaera sp. USBA-960]|uniref:DHA2 family efflux MFS transporter permease subunit n=1 Tax=Salinisphaera orenii TaxID=856731 RepID=UPI000DBE01DA|nr:DHA2 family efflux MFS transporter permease subunit [Salifodinibacter halophilus]NNC25337.1 DHA2 family efflux MFS transporter permease subunit [Salifodinibacter halophilus]